MKKLIWIVAVITIVGLVFWYYMEDRARREVQHAESQRIELATKTSVLQMATRNGARTDWEKSLANPILTIDLEKLWLKQYPNYSWGVFTI